MIGRILRRGNSATRSADQMPLCQFHQVKSTNEKRNTLTDPNIEKTPEFQIESLGSFLTIIPSVVGIVPERSAIFMVFNEDSTLRASVRIDSRAPDEGYQELVNKVIKTEAASIAVVIIDPDPDVVERIVQTILRLVDCPIYAIFCMPVMKVGIKWVELLSDEEGLMPDWRYTEYATYEAVQGRVTYNSMKELEELFSPMEPGVTGREITSPGTSLVELADAIKSHSDVDPGLVGGLLNYSNLDVYASTLSLAFLFPAQTLNIFTNASRYLRGPARVESLVAATCAAYILGEGLLVAAGLNAAFDTKALTFPTYDSPVVAKISDLYHHAATPSEFEEELKKFMPEHFTAALNLKGEK